MGARIPREMRFQTVLTAQKKKPAKRRLLHPSIHAGAAAHGAHAASAAAAAL